MGYQLKLNLPYVCHVSIFHNQPPVIVIIEYYALKYRYMCALILHNLVHIITLPRVFACIYYASCIITWNA